jgi:hypothetical protein
MDSMSEADANRVLGLLHQQHLAQQQQQQAGAPGGEVGDVQQQQQELGGDEDDEGSIVSGEFENLSLVQGMNNLVDGWLDDMRDDDGELDSEFYVSTDDEEYVFGGATSGNGVGGGAQSSSTRSVGRIEPGVIAMAVQGGVIACVDTLGNVLIRDFATGTLTLEQVRQYTSVRKDSEPASSSANSSTASPVAAAAAAAGCADAAAAAGDSAPAGSPLAGDPQPQQQQQQQQQQPGVREAGIPSSRFWRV